MTNWINTNALILNSSISINSTLSCLRRDIFRKTRTALYPVSPTPQPFPTSARSIRSLYLRLCSAFGVPTLQSLRFTRRSKALTIPFRVLFLSFLPLNQVFGLPSSLFVEGTGLGIIVQLSIISFSVSFETSPDLVAVSFFRFFPVEAG